MTPEQPYRHAPGTVRLTVLVENSVQGPDLMAEHGWAVWLEAGRTRILFDAGQSDLLSANARRLGVNLGSVDAVVLSHGHYDHTGGLAAVLAQARPGVPVYAHPEALQPKFHRGSNGVRDIGIPASSRARLQASEVPFQPVTAPTEIAPGVCLTGPIPRRHANETPEPGFCLDPAGRRDDPLTDDQALLVRTSEGIVVLLGCAHAGIINTLDQVTALWPGERLRAVIGGMHLRSAPPERLAWTTDALRTMGLGQLCPAHCTGTAAVARLWTAFPGQCALASVGTALSY